MKFFKQNLLSYLTFFDAKQKLNNNLLSRAMHNIANYSQNPMK